MLKDFLTKIWRIIIRTFAFTSKETRTILHQPRLIFSLILGPFLILLIFGIGYSDDPRVLKTLFVVPEDSQISGLVEDYSTRLGEQIEFSGISQDRDDAKLRLEDNEVDLVVVTPPDPMNDWEEDQQSTFLLYHYEIDPVEDAYIQVLGQRYAEVINNEILTEAMAQSQQNTGAWKQEVIRAREHASLLREAINAGDQARAQATAENLKQDLDLLNMGLSSGVAMVSRMNNTNDSAATSQQLQERLDSLQENGEKLIVAAKEDETLSQSEDSVQEVESTLTEIDGLISQFEDVEPSVLAAPFRSQTLNVTEVRIQPMHFYVPGVIALLIQHLAVTLAGLSIIREKLGGAMEMFRAGPVTSFEMLIGKYLSYALLIGLLSAVLTALVVLALQVPQLGLWINYIFIILGIILASLGLGFNISLSARSNSQAIQFAMLTLLSAIFFSGFFLPLYRLAPSVRIISWMLPATYGTILLKNLMLRGQSPQILLLIALYAFAVALYVLAWFRLRRQMARE